MKKKLFFLLVLLVMLILLNLLLSCKPETSLDDLDNIEEGYVRLKGDFNSGSNVNNFFKKIENLFLIPVVALDIKTLSKVMVFTDFNDYYIKEIVDNNFTIDVKKDKPIGMIFLGKNNEYLGYLSLSNVLDLLPLNSLPENINKIDFGVLSSNNKIVTPSVNPLGNAINLSTDEIEAMKFMSSLFVSIIKNPDVDNDGILDFFEKDYEKFRLTILYYVDGGTFNGKLTPEPLSDNLINGYKFAFSAFDISGRPDYVYFTGPNGSSLNNSKSTSKKDFPSYQSSSFYSPMDTNVYIPIEGEYTINYKDKILKFNISNQSFANQVIILPIPTITINANNTINKINWIYKNSKNNIINNPLSLIKRIQVQIDDINNTRIYDSQLYAGNCLEDIITKEINWDTIKYIHFGYDDVFGNYYVITWTK